MNDNLILEQLYKSIVEHKETKQSARYIEKSIKKDLMCSNCSHFNPKNNKCEVLKEVVTPYGVCSFFSKSSREYKPISIPQTPGNLPTLTKSPALIGARRGNYEIAQDPIA